MQTFLPYAGYAESARCLDNRRLGKQRVECLQIVRALTDPNYGWRNHPAVKMWRGYESELRGYSLAICREWVRRGFKDSCTQKFVEMVFPPCPIPTWLGEKSFHASHRSNLLRKDPAHYGQFGWRESSDLPYVWPDDHLRKNHINLSLAAPLLTAAAMLNQIK